MLESAIRKGYSIEIGGDITLDELRARTASWETGFIRVEDVACNVKVLSGEPYWTGGCHGVFLDWLYMIKDRKPGLWEKMPHWTVVIGKYKGDVDADKTPFYFWLMAAAMAATGSLRVGFLLPSLLSGLGTVVLVYDLLRRLRGREVALAGGLLLLLTFQFVWQARQAQIDATLCFLTTLSLYGLLRHLALGPARGWFLAGWAAARGRCERRGTVAPTCPGAAFGTRDLPARRLDRGDAGRDCRGLCGRPSLPGLSASAHRRRAAARRGRRR